MGNATTQVKMIVTKDSSIVSKSRAPISSDTGLSYSNEYPKSPWSMPVTQLK